MRSRIIATGLHLLGSALVISIALSVIYFIWYPKPFYMFHSVFDAVKIALLVDLVLGPLLMFVIFNIAKPRAELIRDILTIVMLQVAALSWGLHVTYQMRPDFFVFEDNTFYSVLQAEIDTSDLSEDVSAPAFWQQPKSIYVERLSSIEAIKRMNEVIHGGVVVGGMYQTKRYRPLSMQMDSEYMKDILNKATKYATLVKSKTWKSKLELFLKSQGGVGDDYLFYSLENSTQFSGIIIFKRNDFTFAGLLE